MKIRGWMVNKRFELLVPLTVYGPERQDFPDGVFSFDRPEIKTLVFASQGFYKYVDGIPSSGSHELMVVGGDKTTVYTNFNAANAEYAALEKKVGANPGQQPGGGGGVKDPETKPPARVWSFLNWIKANLIYVAVPGLAVLAFVVFGKKIKALFKK